ncbi:MAG: hypothetical protein JXR12_05975 [Neptunomonas phycophila]|uniref:hypothetical protein n=1 Tax=Neptunomonas phycophila TaxID=1572645 RepID=UPI003B8B210D
MGSKWTWLWFVLMCGFAYTTWYLYNKIENSACETIMTNLENLAEESAEFIKDKVDEL